MFLKNWLLRWIASALALFIVTKLVPGIHADNLPTLLLVVIILGLINSFIRPIIMFFVWPINCLTFGLLGFVINVLLFWFVGSNLVPGYHVKSLGDALIGSILMGLLSGFFNFILKDRGDRDNRR
ncbi:MAG TPA: phage holin family protein [Chthonomonadaceae bacterium]|jgi:putative membrane protein|nr:phage holin family protein [Chthonomonadaceae bacterium]